MRYVFVPHPRCKSVQGVQLPGDVSCHSGNAHALHSMRHSQMLGSSLAAVAVQVEEAATVLRKDASLRNREVATLVMKQMRCVLGGRR